MRNDVERVAAWIAEHGWPSRSRAAEYMLRFADAERQHVLNTPELQGFVAGLVLEAQHQRERWGTASDEGKAPADWYWLVVYLAGKCLASHLRGDTTKALHHAITTAAALANWHAAILGRADMRPGIKSPEGT
jgi:hypothetical protein